MEFHIPDSFTDSLAPFDRGLVRAVLVEHDGGALAHIALLHRLADVVKRHRPVDVDELAVLAQHVEELAEVLVRHRSPSAVTWLALRDVYLHLARKRRSFAPGPGVLRRPSLATVEMAEAC